MLKLRNELMAPGRPWKFCVTNKKENAVTRDSETTERLRRLIDQISSLTEKHELHWERQSGSAHRYARLNGNLLILGPATPESNVPRYLDRKSTRLNSS